MLWDGRCSRHFLPLVASIGGLALLTAAWCLPGYGTGDGASGKMLQFPTEGRATDCGAVALYLICKLDGMECSLDDLRARVKTSIIGTDMYNLREGARSLDFHVDAARLHFADLRTFAATAGNYAILHSPLHSHFLAVVGSAEPNHVRTADAVMGVVALTDTDLRRDFGWDGAALLLSRNSPIGGGP